MRVAHGREIRDAGSPSFFLSDGSGGFWNWAERSHVYSGFFALLDDCYRILESIEVEDFSPHLVRHHGSYGEVSDGKLSVSFWMPLPHTLVCELSEERPLRPLLDVKRAYDNRAWGRQYRVEKEGSLVVVCFEKRTDGKEDCSSGTKEFAMHIAMLSRSPFLQREQWVRRQYHNNVNDELERYVFMPGEFLGKKVAIAAAVDKGEAVRLATAALDTLPKGQKKERTSAEWAAFSLQQLLAVDEKLLAGWPWFFQGWTRDTAISAKALMLTGNEALAKRVLLRMLQALLPDGRIPNIAGDAAAAGSADGVGWVFRRCDDLLQLQLLGREEKERVAASLETALARLRSSYEKGGLICNGDRETWMDTSGGTADMREGARIEIQALQLAMYNFAFRLTGNSSYKKDEQYLKRRVRETFWNGCILADGVGDWTVRPNIFIAAYVYAPLLSKKEWETCFENALKELWLPWGGLSSISQAHPLFVDSYTGRDDRSYHRGDSWYWVNSMAALVMRLVNAKKFASCIEKIVAASAEEILWHGAVGAHAEVSSAKQLESRGCLHQAWSSAMFVELMNGQRQ